MCVSGVLCASVYVCVCCVCFVCVLPYTPPFSTSVRACASEFNLRAEHVRWASLSLSLSLSVSLCPSLSLILALALTSRLSLSRLRSLALSPCRPLALFLLSRSLVYLVKPLDSILTASKMSVHWHQIVHNSILNRAIELR